MRTHCPHSDNFTFIALTTAAEADRAVKKLHNKRFLDHRVIVSLQRSNQASANHPTDRKPRSRITGMAPSSASLGKKSTMGSGAGNAASPVPVAMQLPKGRPVYTQPTPPPFDPRASAVFYNPYLTSPVNYHQHYPTMPIHPPPPANYHGQFNPAGPTNPARFDHRSAYPFPPAFIPGGTLPAIQQPSPSSSGQSSRRSRGRRKQFPPQCDGPSDCLPSASLPTGIMPGAPKHYVESECDYDSAVQIPSSSSNSIPSTPSSSDPQSYCIDQTWPPLVSSDLVPESRAWTLFHADKLDDAFQVLKDHSHSAASLVTAGFNIQRPIMPPLADLRAKVKCRFCRSSRQRLDRSIAEEA